MITAERKAILEALAEISELHPEWRFGQMVESITCLAAVGPPTPVYDIEDDAFLGALQSHLEQRKTATLG